MKLHFKKMLEESIAQQQYIYQEWRIGYIEALRHVLEYIDDNEDIE